MNSDQLRPIVEAMTADIPSPEACPDDPCGVGHDIDRCAWLLAMQAKNAAIAALANHAKAIVELVEACERWRDRKCDDHCSGWYHTADCQGRETMNQETVRESLRKLHAIGAQ